MPVRSLIVALALLSACGSSGSSTSASSSSASSAIPSQFAGANRGAERREAGGHLTVLAAGDVDYIDPGAAYYQFTYMVNAATQSSLEALAARRRGGADAAPRRGPPTVSD